MSDLFYAGQAKRTKGAFTVTMKDGAKLAKKLQKLEDGGETAIKRTVSDFTSRAPAWVSKGIRQHYGVDKAAIEEAAKRPKRSGTSIKVKGISVDGATLEYKGRTLTPIHFSMSPKKLHPKGFAKKPLRIPGQKIASGSPVAMVRPPKPYEVKATIIKGEKVTIKGQKAAMMPGIYLAPSSKERADAPNLPFQRIGSGRTPVHAVRTLSVPQMIGSEEKKSRASDTISEIINENLEERFKHHIERAMK